MPQRSRSKGPLPADIRVAVEELGIKIDHIRRDEIWALCPAHKAQTGQADRHASWSINEHTGGHKCFSCGWGGPFIVLVKWMQNSDDENARAWIRQMGGIKHLRARMKGESSYVEPVAERVTEANMALFTPPPRWALEARDVSAEACAAYGVKWKQEDNRWVFPIRDPYTNELRGWQEKNERIFINYPEHMVKADCLLGSHLFEGGRAIIIESPIDAVHFFTYGIPGAMGSMGVNISEDQMSYLLENADSILFALDNDRDGIRMSEKLRKEYLGRIPMEFYNYGDTKDKDPGTQSRVQMLWGSNNATSSVITRF